MLAFVGLASQNPEEKGGHLHLEVHCPRRGGGARVCWRRVHGHGGAGDLKSLNY